MKRVGSAVVPLALSAAAAALATFAAYHAWASYLAGWDPPAQNLHYHLLKKISWVTAPAVGGIACGLVAHLLRRPKAAAVSLASSVLVVLTFSLVSIAERGDPLWLDPRDRLRKAYWQCFALLLPVSAVATAWLVSRWRAARSRSRAQAGRKR